MINDNLDDRQTETKNLKLQMLFNKLFVLSAESHSICSSAATTGSKNSLNSITSSWRKTHRVSHKDYNLND
jgi:hypothetical protein